MRARSLDAAAGAGANFGIRHAVVGIGERLDPPPETLAQAVLALSQSHGEKAGRMVSRFAALRLGAFVWTRVGDGGYRLGRIAGSWRYDDSPDARAVGIHHVRPALWSGHRFSASEAPPAVVATFARGGRNLQRIRESEVERLTLQLWDDHACPASGGRDS